MKMNTLSSCNCCVNWNEKNLKAVLFVGLSFIPLHLFLYYSGGPDFEIYSLTSIHA